MIAASIPEECDIVVVGSGAAGMLAAVRAHDLGHSVVMIEKTAYYGGTSAVSGGGIWVPMNADIANQDSPAAALEYLEGCTRGAVPTAVLAAYVEQAPIMARYLSEGAGVPLSSILPLPDYLSRLPGASRGRTLAPGDMDGKALGEDYFQLREPYSYLKLMGRLSINNFEAGVLAAKAPGWKRLIFRLLRRYWLDVAWRRKTPRDARLCNGQALIGWLRLAMKRRNIPLFLSTRLERLEADASGRIVGVRASRNGQGLTIGTRTGVILAAGGFESNQPMRERYLDRTSCSRFSAAPRGINEGDAIVAGEAVGARLDGMNMLWRAPVLRMPVAGESNVDFALPFFWDRGAPGSICVNRAGERFVDEAVAYDEFGEAMIADNARTGQNLPCWIIFDASCRRRSLIGPLMPAELKPDDRLPPEWLGSVFYRAESIAALASQIGIDPAKLEESVQRFNHAAREGVDQQFDRGGSMYDQFWGNPAIKPNGSLAPLENGPFYAIRLDLGDLGTKGGLATDGQARVLGTDGPIAGLYAVGNCSASIFADAYPGAGGTLGPALTMAMLAANAAGESRA